MSDERTRSYLATVVQEATAQAEGAGKSEQRAENALAKADDARLSAALRFAEARRLAREEGVDWNALVKENSAMPLREVNRFVRIGEADDPAAEIAKLRLATRQKVARLRERRKQEAGGLHADVTHRLETTKESTQEDATAAPAPLAIADGTDPLAAFRAAVDALPAGTLREAVAYLIDALPGEDEAKLALGLARKHGLVAAKQDARGPSASDEPSPAAGPQAEAAPAGTGAGTPAGREGHDERGGGRAHEAAAGNRAGSPPPASSQPPNGYGAADPANPGFDIPEHLQRPPANGGAVRS